MSLVTLALAASVGWIPWSAAAIDRARRDDKPILLVVAADPGASKAAALERDAIAEALADRFVAVRVDAGERPDLADIARLAVTSSSDADPPAPAASLWAVLTPSLHPIAAGDLDGVLAASLSAHLASIATDYAERRTETETRAGIAAARLAAAQVPEPPRGALDAAAVARALAGIRAGGRPTPGAIRFLLAELARSPTAATRGELARALTDFLASPVGHAVAERALRLRVLADGFAATGLAPLREGAEAAAARLLENREPDGAFREAAPGARVFAFENGLAVGALVASASALGRDADRDAASKAAVATIANLGPWSALARCAGPSGRCGAAFLEDHAFLAEALLDLHDATGEPRWRDEARAAVDAATGRFLDASAGGFFDTDGAHAPLPVRLKSGYDGARPSANGVMASVLLRLAVATGERRYADMARSTVDAFRGDLQRAPRGMETMAASAIPLVALAGEVAGEGPRSSRETHGPVTVELSLDPARARPGAMLEAQVRLTVAPPWTLSGHHPGAGDLVPLTVSAPGDRFTVGPVTYPSGSAITGSALVVVPFRVRADSSAGPSTLRLTIRFQRCRGPECQAPESVILEAPMVVGAGAR